MIRTGSWCTTPPTVHLSPDLNTYRAGWGPAGSSGVRWDRMETTYEYWLDHECPNPTEHHDRQTGESVPPECTGRTLWEHTERPSKTRWVRLRQTDKVFTSGGRGTEEGRSSPSWSQTQNRSFLLWANHRNVPKVQVTHKSHTDNRQVTHR